MSSTQRDVLVLLRLVDNRLCADCDTPLGETAVSGSCTFGTWICEKCSDIHASLRASKLKSATDTWSEEEVNFMRMAGSNTRVNKIYERYIPNGWRKCRPDSPYEDRDLWIRAKYEFKMFALPQKRKRTESISAKPLLTSLPVRIVDFFLVISPGACHQNRKSMEGVRPDSVTFDPIISSCYPGPEFYKDMLLPEHVSPFVFPRDVHLSSIEKTPYFFTFVLTDVSGTKMYGATLHVYELVETDELSNMLGIPINSPAFPNWPLVFAPKALTVISHYAFFNLYREFLEQLYRISLSSSPIPIERYIVNFVHEVPLPPQGQIEVNFALADRNLWITRPPKNRLPMVDFSYRPLFTCLSVENILLVFAVLCTESKVCICSDNIALLTPVQEAFLSLLFPLVWQGAYIPVIPLHMEDILDAPVPILVGIHGSYLRNPEQLASHPDVVYVDLDNDRILWGKDEQGRPFAMPPPLPARAESKLRTKLMQFGGHIFRHKSYPPAGEAFPRREYLTPIRVFATEQGVIQRPNSYSKGVVKRDKSSLKSIFSNHPTVCTKSTVRSSSILDPNNNIGTGGDTFNASEIRGAFLRFFVSVLRDYGKVATTAADRLGVSSVHMTAIQQLTEAGDTTTGRPAPGRHSLTSQSKAVSPFLLALQDTQMFEKLSEERVERPYQPEIKFFDESILEKLNRSMSIMRYKSSLPFLSDISDEISEAYTPPPPSSWGVPVDQSYSYLKFPLLRSENFGPVRRAKPLLRSVEVQRTRAVINEELFQMLRVRRASFAESDVRQGLENVMSEAKQHFHRFNRAITSFQSRRRMRRFRLPYLRIRRAAIRVQRAWRAVRLRRLNELYNAREKALVCRIQAWIRGHLARKQYIRLMAMVVRLQSFCRMVLCIFLAERQQRAALKIQTIFRGWSVYKKYLHKKLCAVRIQALVRGWILRKRAKGTRRARIMELRKQMFELWKLEHTPLIYRSQFWKLLNGSGFLHLSAHEDELRRLWSALGMDNNFNSTMKFPQMFVVVNQHIDNGMIISTLNRARSSSHSRNVIVKDAINKENTERKELYNRLKKHTTPEVREEYFRMFLLSGKKKKQTLVNDLLWLHLSFADSSAVVMLAPLSETDKNEWLRMKQRERVRRSALQTVQACLLSLQRLRTTTPPLPRRSNASITPFSHPPQHPGGLKATTKSTSNNKRNQNKFHMDFSALMDAKSAMSAMSSSTSGLTPR